MSSIVYKFTFKIDIPPSFLLWQITIGETFSLVTIFYFLFSKWDYRMDSLIHVSRSKYVSWVLSSLLAGRCGAI
jgi:hypothetical protein